MSKQIKDMMIEDLKSQYGDRKDFVVLDLSKLDGVTACQVRNQLAAKGITVQGVKNTLARVAFKQSGMDVGADILSGPTTLVWGGEDIVGLSREMAEWAKKIDQIQIKGGVVDGTAVNAAGVEGISKGPSRLELIGQISGLLLSPGRRLSGALLGAGGKLAGQIKSMSEPKEEGGDAA